MRCSRLANEREGRGSSIKGAQERKEQNTSSILVLSCAHVLQEAGKYELHCFRRERVSDKGKNEKGKVNPQLKGKCEKTKGEWRIGSTDRLLSRVRAELSLD